ncbi:hypothetical protein BYT27DRAFT_6485745 [Phlegmacium glaucopus]|nr:hypothetical protein BYT27DRAFT_6485745 [Phlegmacium glaucopus]
MRRSHSKDYGPVQGVVMVQLKDVINTMKDNFQRTRVPEEVRTEGYASIDQARSAYPTEQKTWQTSSCSRRRGHMSITDRGSRQLAAKHLKVRSIVKVTKAFALGDLSKQIEVDARDAIRSREYSQYNDYKRWRRKSQGELGGQAHVPDVEGV